MWGMIVATILQFKGVIGNLAIVLLGPYLVWVSYASALTLWIWQHNAPAAVGRKVSLCFGRWQGRPVVSSQPTQRGWQSGGNGVESSEFPRRLLVIITS